MFKKLKAFTLAEALIVIAIIGVIAAVALPILKANYQTKAFHSALKKNYYVLTSILQRYELETFRKIKKNDTDIIDKISNYLNVHKKGDASNIEGEGGCPLATEYYPKGMTTKYDDKWRKMYQYGSLILQDGTLIMVGTNTQMNVYMGSTYFYIDVNGYDKGPNIMGEDLYILELESEGQLLPMGAPNTDYYPDDSCKYNWWGIITGSTCAYTVISKGE